MTAAINIRQSSGHICEPIKLEVILHHPDDGDDLRNIGFYNSSDAAVCPRKVRPVLLL
jgi:hypothetical protein